ncbi:MAG: HD domain-containing phosphohydrolase [Rhodospirillaceae bacterium]|nr:HD domain-containing phosphohydrolase [Rhodospirillaceae bacterium]
MADGGAAIPSSSAGPDGGPYGGGLERLIEIGLALSAERNHDRLTERILLEAIDITKADGGTLYLRTDDNSLKFVIVRNGTLKIAMGGTTGVPINFPPLRMYNAETGAPNHNNVATHVALTGKPINIEDAYTAEGFDFSGTKKFDQGTGYRSKSFLTIPLKNYGDEVIGVLQLINATDGAGTVIAFSKDVQRLVEALASQAAVAIDNQQLIEAQKALMDSLIKVMAHAIDAKSPYTGGHCQRVPELTKMLAIKAHEATDGPFKDFKLDETQWYELHVAAWLHDIGKVTTPEYVVDKATKLQTIYDRVHEVRMRFEVLRRDAEIKMLKAIAKGKNARVERKKFKQRCAELDAQWKFVAESNIGGEFMSKDKQDKIREIAKQRWYRHFDRKLGLAWAEGKLLEDTPPPAEGFEYLLADLPEHARAEYHLGEVLNLCIARGTLNDDERKKINDHIVLTIDMLKELPFPKHLKAVPEYAGGHHEKMDGTGYPNRLRGEQMSVPARIMAIADIFEALTAADRPYKKAKTLSESVKILYFMKKDKHVDPDLFELFLSSGAYKDYAEQFLRPEQVDVVNIDQYLDSKKPPPPPQPQQAPAKAAE